MDWNSSALWGIIGLIGGFVISFIFYKISTKNKKIVYTKNSQTLITDNLSKINDLNITYQNKPIKNLTTSTVCIKSIGKDTIEMNDFGKATPLCIKTDGEFLLQSDIVSTITNNSNINNMMLPILKDSDTILLEFDYLAQGDSITFVLLHTGTLSIAGKLKSGTLLDNTAFNKINNVLDIISYICCGFLIFLAIIMYIIFSGVDGTFINIGNFLINLLFGIILVNYCKKIFKKFINVEISLRDSDNNQINF